MTTKVVEPTVADPFVTGPEEDDDDDGSGPPKAHVPADPFEAALAGATPEKGTGATRIRGDVIATVPVAVRNAVEQAHADYHTDVHTPAGTPVFRTVRFNDVKTAELFKKHARKYAGARPDGKVTVRATVTPGQPGEGVFVRYTATPHVAKPRKAKA